MNTVSESEHSPETLRQARFFGARRVLLGCVIAFAFGRMVLVAQDGGRRDEAPIPPPPVPDSVQPVEVRSTAPQVPAEQLSTQVGSVSAVDETVRFGVSLTDLHAQTAGALAEVLWSHAEGGADAISALGFSISDAGAEVLVTVLPKSVMVSEHLRIGVRRNGGMQAAELLLFDAGTGVSLLRIGASADGNPSESPAGNAAALEGRTALALNRGPQPDAGAVVFGFDRSGNRRVDRCVPGRIAGRDSRYQGETLPTSLWRIHMHLTGQVAGGPLLDESGAVVGVMTDRELEALDELHAVPVPVLQRLLRDLGSGRQAGVAWIGATFHLDSSTPQIVGVRPDSPAQQAGLRSHDVVVSIGGEAVRTLDELADAFYYLSAGQPTEVEVLRGLEKISFQLVPSLFDNRDLDGDGVVDGDASLAPAASRGEAESGEEPSAAVRQRD